MKPHFIALLVAAFCAVPAGAQQLPSPSETELRKTATLDEIDAMSPQQLMQKTDEVLLELQFLQANDPDTWLVEAIFEASGRTSVSRLEAINQLLSDGPFDSESQSDRLAISEAFDKVQNDLNLWDSDTIRKVIEQTFRYGDDDGNPETQPTWHFDRRRYDRLKALFADQGAGLISEQSDYEQTTRLLEQLEKYKINVAAAASNFKKEMTLEDLGYKSDWEKARTDYREVIRDLKIELITAIDFTRSQTSR